MNIMKGDYKAAAACADGLKGDNAALAQLLAGNNEAASAALQGDAPRTDYIRAILAARKGNTAEARKLLEAAGSKDEALKKRAEKDIEFAALAN